MGLDGGTIASRSDVLRRSSWRLTSRNTGHRSTRGGQLASDFTAAQAEERVSERERREAAWSSCALTGVPLRGSIVACSLGHLYNKESIVQFLLSLAGVEGEGDDKWVFLRLKQLKSQFPHITSRKDVFEVRFQSETQSTTSSQHPSRPSNSKGTDSVREREGHRGSPSLGTGAPSHSVGDGAIRGRVSEQDCAWVCPITGLRLDGPHSCSALRTCGHVISDKALKQVKEKSCPVCSKPYSEDDLVRLNRPQAEVEQMREELKRKKEEEVPKRKRQKKQEKKQESVDGAS